MGRRMAMRGVGERHVAGAAGAVVTTQAGDGHENQSGEPDDHQYDKHDTRTLRALQEQRPFGRVFPLRVPSIPYAGPKSSARAPVPR